ncbi:hypothetical protein RSAG8_13945, partial [Rhizoctonia solani AG-8 WAC10335]
MSASRGSVNSRTSKHTSSSRLRDVGVSDSGVSGASAKSYITSASELATKLEEFNAWAQKAKLDPVIKTTLPNTVIFNPIRDLQAASTTIPESPEFGFIPPTLLKWKDALCSTLQQSGSKYSTSHSANDDPDLPYVVNSIFRLCRNHEIARLPINANGSENEAGIRSPLDNFFMNICQIDSPRFRYHVEQKLKLPACMTSKAKVTMTKADGVLSVPIPGFGPYDLSPELRAAASAFVGTPEPPILMLVHCVVEFKRTDNGENQTKMGIASALYQKKVLGIESQFAFGIFQIQTDFLRVVVARWVGGKIRIYSVGTYSLRSPMSLLELYFVILGIRQLATTYEEELFQSGPN